MKITNDNIDSIAWVEWEDDNSTAIIIRVEREECPPHDPNVYYLSREYGMQRASLSWLAIDAIGHTSM